MGHECKDSTDSLHNHKGANDKEEKKTKGEKKTWIPSAIAKVMKDVMNVANLRTKLAEAAPLEEEKIEVECGPPRNPQSQITTHMSSQEEVEEEGWTPVAPGKVARRHQNKSVGKKSHYTKQAVAGLVIEDI